MNLQLLCDQATAFHQKGQIARAEQLCLQILAVAPENPTACHLLGLVRLQQGRYDEARRFADVACETNPGAPEPLVLHGLLLQRARRLEEALVAFGQALKAKEDHVEALINRGNVQGELGLFADAVKSYDKVIALTRGNIEATYNRAYVLGQMGRLEESLAGFDAVAGAAPSFTMVWINRGDVLRKLLRPREAVTSFDRALSINSGLPEVWVHRGDALLELHRPDEAITSYDRALKLAPAFAEAWNNRGNVLQRMRRNDDALACYERALALKPDFAEALYNRGSIEWVEKHQYDAAVRDLERAAALDPDRMSARRDLLLHLRMHRGDWRDFDRDVATLDAGVRAGKSVVAPFVYAALSGRPEDLQACSLLHAAHHYPPGPAVWTSERRPRDKIRLGYVSGEFRAQATAFLMAELYELHDKTKFELVAFDNGVSDGSPVRKRLEVAFDSFVDMSNMSDKTAAERIATEKIDILINLNGYFGEHRMGVFARKPAPIQVNYLGFPGTLGAPYMDYILADRLVIPEDERRFYVEKVIYLPDTYQVNDSKRPIASTSPTRRECSLPENGFVYCNFNQSYKLVPAMFSAWMRILAQVEGSVLWLLESNTLLPDNLRREAAGHGISGDRLIFAPMVELDRHLTRLRLADLFLDSLPYNAHTTASDALWAGLPLLTCRGTAFPGRVASSLLRAIDLTELVAEGIGDYEALALRLAREPGLLDSLRRKLAANRLTTRLFNTQRFRRNIEAAYMMMWEIFQRGDPPKSFSVEAEH